MIHTHPQTMIDWQANILEIASEAGKETLPLAHIIQATMINWSNEQEIKSMEAKALGSYMSQGYIIESIDTAPEPGAPLDFGKPTYSDYRAGERATYETAGQLHTGEILHITGNGLYIIDNPETGFPDVVAGSELIEPGQG